MSCLGICRGCIPCETEAAHHLGVGLHDAQLLPLVASHRRDRADQLIFDRHAQLERRQHDFLQAARKRHAHDEFFFFERAAGLRRDLLPLNAEPLFGLGRRLAEQLQIVVHSHVHSAARLPPSSLSIETRL